MRKINAHIFVHIYIYVLVQKEYDLLMLLTTP